MPYPALPIKIHWTEHSKIKMRQYRLSKIKMLNLLRKPERKEPGIVPGTTAVMMRKKSYVSKKQSKGEIWMMYKDANNIRKIISAWIYPGVSRPGQEVPVPEEIRQEILYGNLI
jgi:hypothetical protein